MAENKNFDNMPNLGKMGGGGPRRFAPIAKPKNTKATLFRLLNVFLLWRRSFLVAVALTILSSTVSLLTPWLLGKAINTFNTTTNSVDTPLLKLIILALVSCYLVSWVIDTFNGVLMAKVTQELIKHIRNESFAKLQRIPLNFYDRRSHGDTMSRITNDVDNISTTISQTTTQLIASIFTITGSCVMMLILSPALTLVAMVSIPLFLVLTKTIARRSREYFLGQQQKLGDLNGVIEENIVSLKMVKAFNQQQTVLADFNRLNRELCSYSTKAQIWSGLMMPFMNVINNLSFTFIACAGGILSVRGVITVGVVVSFLTYSKQFGQPLNSIAGMFNNIQSALAGAERVFEIMDEEEEAPDKESVKESFNPKGEVEFRNVSFSYNPGSPVLNNICFKVRPGEVIALVGETGAGKTTIVNLLTRFYELDQGKILIDNTDITEISRASLRNCFSVVLQDTCLFTGTIYENIRYSNPDASKKEVREAAKLAHADDFISRLPKGYDTIVTGSTDNLSQGQRQLLAIARAILCNAPILILDEATSSVDTKTEKEIQHALLTLMNNRTSFLIAHRLSTIRDADKIMVIGRGEILESGTHSELMKNKSTYFEMVTSQMGSTSFGVGCEIGIEQAQTTYK
ncbi:ABC-type multidrug transport system, ATPase and permease component [Desulfosporosinus orientis DSM 765]|uniref:ABC-type multidrug transport system, ATPase and permease component n=1 Tax=Desulfosporosinus orientis (strain ATCC 19365 / DSM 765 / NCIMB 8382 / VKM B-1628 / Singapore I) TaxID=768706 RepID=G7W7W0_DESOD|nr:ABC transporter ATP-binding protein [Desulfosporosinus orientis]AET66386.1 ABC-type multidrug transport system, ATPase and permease component [Desulfosporosinus orientis DSM 765]